MKIGLFIPCYVNTVYPEVAIASYKLLTHFGLDVDYPVDQTCCGQPMANAGFENKALPLANRFNSMFETFDYVVAPSGSCVGFVKDSYPKILEKEGCLSEVSSKVYDICEFLHDILKINKLPGRFQHKVSLHNSCHGLRELKLGSASELNIPSFSKVKDLLGLIEGVEVVEPAKVDECCGFGGMFSIEEPAVSICMGQDKIKNHINTGAEFITGPDSSCLMHMGGIIEKQNLPIKTIHVVQILSAGL
ncbi:(Fe-S)-binding protein [Apibacter sp. HY039]|uniref:(Fe-S)-binding protein n=1 Tax=Apibacter sp. HY039 TaxID=2501476 RepID=UPI000FEBDDA8|nr:(Fe-S)-binding protein [Apibacter sp. HY039]